MNDLNPFLWTGPWFLLFYALFGMLVCYIVRERIRRRELSNPHLQLSVADDPYRIAFLRGGALEAAQIAAIVLVDRGLLRADGPQLATAGADSLRFASHEIERDVLRLYLGHEGHSKELAAQAAMLPACRAYHDELTQQKLLLGEPLFKQRERSTWVAHYLLLTVAAVKAIVAIGNGHYNLLFLAILLALLLLKLRTLRLNTPSWSGQRLLTDLRMLFGRLNMRSARLTAGDGSADMALLAAIFGIAALPSSVYPYIAAMYPMPRPNAQAGSDASAGDSGSGDSSSGGGDGGDGGGGSSCGGGGSGCGGCGGGCGS